MHDTDAYSLSHAEAVAEAAIALGDGCPGGQCAIASWVLCEMLRQRGVDPVFVLGGFCHPKGACDDHAWVEVDGMIIDPTASQFGLPDVLIVYRNDERYARGSTGRDAYRDVMEVFPPDQRPSPANVARFKESLPGMYARGCRARDSQPAFG